MAECRERGNLGEAAVAEALLARGWEVLERQFRCRWGEIDLIARDPQGILCFVEVKARSAGTSAREAVTPAKQRRLRNAAGFYLARSALECLCRFDVAEVYPGQEGWERPRIRYYKNAFQ